MEDDQQFCLRWNNHQTTLIQNFDTLLESGTLVDCTLAAEGKYLKAHKVVLSACSPYFEGLLSEHYDKHPVFILKDVKFKELKAMMDYMYRGEVNISQDQLAALLKAAESLQIKGLSESRGGNGGPKSDVRQPKVSAQSSAPSLDIPHASSGLTIEKNSKVPRQSLTQSSVTDLPEDSASPQIPKGLSSREGSQSPTTRRKKRIRRRSLGDDNSMENHEASNSSDINQQSVPALGIAPIADDKHTDPSDSLGRSALMQQLTKPADELLQLPIEKPEPTEEMIQPKSEYLEDPEESVEDLTLDDDMNDLNEMEQDSSRAGPSTHDPSQHPGMSWHVTGDRSNAGGVGAAGAPGAQDEVFMAAHDAVQAQRDSQGYTSIMRYLRVIRTDLRDISSVQHEMKSMLETSKGIIKTNVKGFTEEYNLDLPFKEMTDFRLFDMRLGTDPKFRQDFMSSLYFLLDRENVLTKSVTNILRKFMSRDVALKFTAVKQSVGKLILKETYFAECLKDFFEFQNYDEQHPANRVTEKALYNAVGAALTNSKDWDGFRSIRSNQRKQ